MLNDWSRLNPGANYVFFYENRYFIVNKREKIDENIFYYIDLIDPIKKNQLGNF